MADFILDGINLKEGEEGPDGGPFRISWKKAHRIQVKEIPYFRDKSIVTSGKGDPNSDGNPGAKYSGTLWELTFQVRSISFNRWQFFKGVSETPGPHSLLSAFGKYNMYLKEATFDQGAGEREPIASGGGSDEGKDLHFLGSGVQFIIEYVGTWTFNMVEVHH